MHSVAWQHPPPQLTSVSPSICTQGPGCPARPSPLPGHLTPADGSAGTTAPHPDLPHTFSALPRPAQGLSPSLPPHPPPRQDSLNANPSVSDPHTFPGEGNSAGFQPVLGRVSPNLTRVQPRSSSLHIPVITQSGESQGSPPWGLARGRAPRARQLREGTPGRPECPGRSGRSGTDQQVREGPRGGFIWNAAFA